MTEEFGLRLSWYVAAYTAPKSELRDRGAQVFNELSLLILYDVDLKSEVKLFPIFGCVFYSDCICMYMEYGI